MSEGIYPLINDIIGVSFSTDPYGYLFCCFFVLWVTYNIFNFLYKVFRL